MTLFSPHREAELLELVLDALANPLRRSLIERLTERDINVSDLADGAGVSMPSISRHLRVLEKANLIVRLKQGRNHMISLRREPLQLALQWCTDVAHAPDSRPAQPIKTPVQPAEPVPVSTESVLPTELFEPQPEPAASPESLDLSPDSLSDLVKRLKKG